MPLKRKRTNVYSEGQTTASDALKRQQVKSLQNESYDGSTEFFGTIIRVEDVVQSNLAFRVFTLGQSSKYYAVRVRIPELHDGQLPPIPHKESGRNKDGVIDLHPLFEGSSTRVPNVGDGIRVSFIDRNNSSIRSGNGRILEIIPAATKGIEGFNAYTPDNTGKSASSCFTCGSAPGPALSYNDKLIEAIERYESKSVANPKKTPSSYKTSDDDGTRTVTEERQQTQSAPAKGNNTSNRPEDDTASGSPPDPGNQCGVVTTVGSTTPPPQAILSQGVTENTVLPLDPIANVPCKRLSSKFGMRFHPTEHVYKGHKGVDYADGRKPNNRNGRRDPKCVINFKPCYSSLDGVVVAAMTQGTGIDAFKVTRNTPGNRGGKPSGAGKYVKIKHSQYGELYTLYMHLSAITVKRGQKVKRGDQLGLMDNTGGSSGPHLHYEVRRGGAFGKSAIDPEVFLRTPLPKK